MIIRKPMSPNLKKQCQCQTKRRGASIVEFALIVPVVLAILLGILESAWMSKNYLSVANAAREGARSASLGKTTTVIRTRVQNTAEPVDVPTANIALAYSTDNGATYVAMGDSGTQNSAPGGSMVRVNIRITHQSLTRFFPFLNNRTIAVAVVMRREAT
jgi:Flp pilus assembly protein TadG